MKRFSDDRKIKIFGDVIKSNKSLLLPNTLREGYITDDSIKYPTQFFIKNSNLKEVINVNNKQLIKSNRTYSQLMEIPDLSLPLTDILNIYDIDTYDELIELIKKLLFNDSSEYTIYRLINIYTIKKSKFKKKAVRSPLKRVIIKDKIKIDKIILFFFLL